MPPGAPTYQEYLDQREKIDELRRYQVEVLGDARDRLSDEDNPLNKDELEAIQRDVSERAPDTIQINPEPASAPAHNGPAQNFGAPKL